MDAPPAYAAAWLTGASSLSCGQEEEGKREADPTSRRSASRLR